MCPRPPREQNGDLLEPESGRIIPAAEVDRQVAAFGDASQTMIKRPNNVIDVSLWDSLREWGSSRIILLLLILSLMSRVILLLLASFGFWFFRFYRGSRKAED